MRLYFIILTVIISQALQGNSIDSLQINQKVDSLLNLSNTEYSNGNLKISADLRSEAISHLKTLKNWKELITQYNYLYFTAVSMNDLITIENALDSASLYSAKYITDKDQEKYYLLANISNYYHSQSNYLKAIEYQEKAIRGFKSLNISFINYYNNIFTLMDSYYLKGEMDLALSTCKTYVSLFDSIPEHSNWMKSDLLNHLAIYQRENEQFEEAIHSLNQARKLSKEISDQGFRNSIEFTTLQSMALTYRKMGQYEKSIAFCELANTKQLQISNKLFAHNYMNLGQTYRENKEYQKALEQYKLAVDMHSSKKNFSPKFMSSYSVRLAYCYLKNDQLDSALVHYKEAEKYLDINLDLPLKSIDEYSELNSFNLNSILALSWFAEIENHQAKSSNNPEFKERALRRYQQAFNGSKYLQKELISKSSKYLLNKNLQENFSNYFHLLLEKYEHDSSQENFQTIIQLIEDNKAITLKEDIHDKTLLAKSKVPEAVIQKEESYLSNINTLKIKLHKHQVQSKKDSSTIEQWENKITELRRDYASFQKTLEQEYPNYYSQKYELRKINLESIQEKLNLKDVILNYFTTEDTVYCLLLSKNKHSVFKVGEKNKLLKDVEAYLEALKLTRQKATNADQLRAFKELSHRLYLQLLPQETTKGNKRLIISPTTKLHYLPFETLLENPDEGKSNYKELSYLIRSKSIEYAFSSDLWLESKSANAQDSKPVAASFAPFTEKNESLESRSCEAGLSLGTLPCSIDEVTTIETYFRNTNLFGEKATVDEFMKLNNVDIIHLATHACLDKDDPNFNKLMFYNEDVSLLELENMDLDADLAILSACNTATGKLESGEGVINLSKGFRKAGVKSMISTLWAINDCATGEIVQNFYENLDKSGDISTALQSAKLEYLEQADKRHAHPYYWAGLVFSGDSTVFQDSIQSSSNFYVYLAILLVALLAFFYFRQK